MKVAIKGAFLAQQTFGNRLAEARRRRGLTLEQVHAQLRISPTILEALEVGDFRHMPLKGHARNMVSSYARYLGLDPEDMTKQFLGEYHDFENREARSVSSTFSSSSFGSGVTRIDHVEAIPSASQRTGKYAEGQSATSMWDKPIPKSELNRGYDSRSQSAQRVANAASRRRAQSYDDRLSSRSGSGSYTPQPSLPMRVFSVIFRSPAVLVVVLIVLIVALLVVWAMVANSCRGEGGEIIPINAGGSVVVEDTPETTDTTDPATDVGQEAEDESQYGPFELTVTPAEGTGPWTEVTVDGENVCAELLSETKTWQVTDKCVISTGQPDNLKITRNDVDVTLDVNEAGIGTVELTVQTKPDNQASQTNQENQEAGTNG
jgi:cytoskeletal protein RodZ